MRVVRSKDYRAERAWGADLIAAMQDATVRLHWTDQPYGWHVNHGQEVFAVMDGAVDMHYRRDGAEQTVRLQAGDIFFVDQGEAHSAHPCGQARILVIERAGSV
ncbi:cupin [Duganella rhizosphaerae]|uniref:cupin domain-containing protein n=1 Tax=Duganella rhizosphaerae TaxID=2885763 RepID=UPI0030E9C1DF